MSYLGEFFARCLAFAFSRTFYRADALSVFAGLGVPAWYWVRAVPIPEWTAGFISFLILIISLAFLLIRLLTAPYFVWREEKSRVDSLTDLLYSQSQRRRDFFENSALNDRYELSRELTFYVLMNASVEDAASLDVDAHINALSRRAILFLGDVNFRRYWDTFSYGVRLYVRGARFLIDHRDILSSDRQQLVSQRIEYDEGAMKAGATAMVYILTENHEHANLYEDIITELGERLPKVANADLQVLWGSSNSDLGHVEQERTS
jgi:hypothetical protein